MVSNFESRELGQLDECFVENKSSSIENEGIHFKILGGEILAWLIKKGKLDALELPELKRLSV